MTNETTYREKGRALFLAAMMVLSVVAMSAAFAGAAAAEEHTSEELAEEAETDVAYSDYEELDDAWIGQEIAVAGFGTDDEYEGDYIEIREGADTSDDSAETVTSQQIEQYGDEDYYAATFETDELESGEPYHIVNLGQSTEEGERSGDAHVFSASSEELDVDFGLNIVQQDNEEEVIDVESERESQDLNVSADGLDTDDLMSIFSDDEDYEDDDIITIEDVGEDESLDADFSDIDADDYEFEFDVTDSDAVDNASVTVTDDGADYAFADIDDVEQGDYAEITIDVDQDSSAIVAINEEDVDFTSAVEVTGIEDDEVVLTYDTNAPSSEDAWDVHEDDDSDAETGDVYQGNSTIDQPLPEHTWDVNIGPDSEVQEDVIDEEHIGDGEDVEEEIDGYLDISEFDDYDRDRLTVDAHTGFGDTVTSVAPSDEDVDDFESFDEYATESDTLAEEDQLFLTLEDFGAEAAFDSIDSVDDEEFLANMSVEITQDESDLLGDDETVFNSTHTGDDEDLEELDIELITTDSEDYDGDLIFQIEPEDGLENLEYFEFEDSEHEVTFTVLEDNHYVSEDDEYEEELELDFEERNLEWDSIDSLAADEEATGTTNVAPGTELEAEADSPSDEGGFVDYTGAEVSDDQTFAADFSLEDEEVGSLFDMTVTDNVPEEDLEDELEDVELLDGDGEPDEEGVSVDADYDANIDVDEETDIDAIVSNYEDDELELTLELDFDGEVYDEEITVDGDDELTETLVTADGEDLGEGDHDFSISVENDDFSDEYDGTVTVAEEDDGDDSDDNGADDDGEADDDADDDTPGFGVAVAVVALLGAAMLALRQQN